MEKKLDRSRNYSRQGVCLINTIKWVELELGGCQVNESVARLIPFGCIRD